MLLRDITFFPARCRRYIRGACTLHSCRWPTAQGKPPAKCPRLEREGVRREMSRKSASEGALSEAVEEWRPPADSSTSDSYNQDLRHAIANTLVAWAASSRQEWLKASPSSALIRCLSCRSQTHDQSHRTGYARGCDPCRDLCAVAALVERLSYQ